MSCLRVARSMIVLVAGLLLAAAVDAAPGDPAGRAGALDRAILADDCVAAWSLAESLAGEAEPWASRGVAALTRIGEDLARCSDDGRLPSIAGILGRSDVDAWLR